MAYNIEERTVTQTGANGQSTTTTTVTKTILTGPGGAPVILWTNPPNIISVVVVAAGAGDVSVRMNIIRAVQTVVGTSPRIEILTGN